MLSKFSIRLLLSFAILCLPSSANAQGTFLTPTTHGYRIVITNITWQTYNALLPALSLVFAVEHADGTPVSFVTPQGAVMLDCWTDADFEGSNNHSASVYYNSSNQTWQANISGIDPRQNRAHIEFDIRDPRTTAAQTSQLTSDIQFDNVPVPSQQDTTLPLNDTFTTDWGTQIKLSGITLFSKDKYGQPDTTLQFSIEHSKVPDDDAKIQFERAYDNGVAINDIYPRFNNLNGPDTPNVTLSALSPGSHKTISLDFLVNENAYSTVKSIVWIPVQADLPLSSLVLPKSQATVSQLSDATFNGVHFQLQTVRDTSAMYNTRYLILTQSKDPHALYKVTKSAWSTDPLHSNWQSIGEPVYRDGTGSLLASGEWGTQVTSFSQQPFFPLQITAQQTVHDQQIVSFHLIPLPTNGQTLVLKQKPVGTAVVPLVLKSISLNAPSTSNTQIVAHRYNRMSGNQNVIPAPFRLGLTFEYVDEGASSIGVTTIAVRDGDNNALDTPLLTTYPAGHDPSSVSPDIRTCTVYVPVPPGNSKFINLRLLVTKDTPIGDPIVVKVDASGACSLVPNTGPTTGPIKIN